MRVVLIAAAAVVLAGLGWWIATDPGNTDSGLAPPDVVGQEPDPTPQATAGAVSAERNRLPEPAMPKGETTEPAAELPDGGGEAAGAPDEGLLRLDVRAQDGSPLEAFRYVLMHADGRRSAERIHGHEAELALALDAKATLTVEAEGFEPSEEMVVQLTASEPERRLPVTLVAYSAFSGVELWVTASNGAPIRHLEVEAARSDAPERALWQRRAKDERGRYELPDLKPGVAFELRLRALDDEGEIAAYVPHQESVTFTSGRDLRTVTLQPGCFFSVDVEDGAGQVLGQEVNLRLVHPDGSAPPTRWRTEVEGERVQREDGLPAAARARLVDPVAPGSYVLQGRIGSGPVTELPVELGVGREPTLTLRLSP